MVFDFAARPPEVNSTLVYSGAGAGPLMAAASTFSGLSSELATNATAYEGIISQLTGSSWTGPSSTAAAAAAQQSIDWLNTTSVQLQEAAAKATASAAAYEAAFSATIPPPVVYANRAQLAALVATNILGQNTPAIAANEALYGEFWAQDATALTTYAGTAATTAQVTPLTEPTQNTNPGGSGAQSAAVANAVNSNASNSGLNGLLSNLQGTASSAANPAASSAAPISDELTSLYNSVQSFWGIGAVGDTVNTIDVTLSWCIMMMSSALGTLAHFTAGAPFGVTIGDVTPLGAGLGFGTTLAGASSGVGGLGGATLAGMGSASSVGGMSVPAGWSAAAPGAATEATLAGSGWTAAVDEGAVAASGGGMNGVMPGMASAGGKSGMGLSGPRYGVKPKVMPKQVFV
jgi:PPE-repeat protein